METLVLSDGRLEVEVLDPQVAKCLLLDPDSDQSLEEAARDYLDVEVILGIRFGVCNYKQWS